ncbi:aldo/keto reductase [Actinoallomurus acaciae]|uniref:Aldo/keto reductase n=1 Tax=Actinoallomurus acaciae TaxID=502577 RepID=A0ABV5YQD8_9ACTN
MSAVRHDASRMCLGTMYFGTTVPEDTARRLLDRYLERGGRLIDTANCYCFWADGGTGEESEEVIGRWMEDRGVREEILLATKVGSRPEPPGSPWPESAEGLRPKVIHEQFARSAERLRTDRFDVYFAHVDDADTELEETAEAFDALVKAGSVGMLGASNISPERFAAARETAAKHGWAPYEIIQLRHTYLLPDPNVDYSPQRAIDGPLLEYTAAQGDILLQGYSPLLGGTYTREDRELAPEYRGADNARRLETVRRLSGSLGITPNQLVLAWMAGGDPPITPVLGVSTVAQLDEAMDGVTYDLPPSIRAELDTIR